MVPAAFAAALQAFDRRLDPASAAPVATALSGGSDSLALLRIARAWTAAVGRPLWALTVDHRLHPDSAAWTAAAGEAARRLGVAWRPLAWEGPKPTAGLPAAARSTRHALLTDAARALGARVLLVGHTADDVAESELIRAETPTHGRLAEWSPSPAWPEGRDIFILRPLLSLRRTDLRAWLGREGVTWLEDPANTDPRFARSRARTRLAGASTAVPGAAAAALLHPQQAPIKHLAEGHPADVAVPERFGALDLALAGLAAAERPADLLAKALLCVSGGSRPPPGPAVQRLLAQLAAAEPFTVTLCGARVRVEGGRLRLTRELGRTRPAARPLSPAMAHVFDGRFELTAQHPGWRVAPLAGHAAGLPRCDREVVRGAPPEARPSLPVLLGPGDEVRLPQPFGSGPADARSLVGDRLAAALGRVTSESGLEPASPSRQARGAAGALILS